MIRPVRRLRAFFGTSAYASWVGLASEEGRTYKIYKTPKVHGYFFCLINSSISSQALSPTFRSSKSKFLNSNPFHNLNRNVVMSSIVQPKQTIAVFGATGGCTLNFTIRALQNGHSVSARKSLSISSHKHHLITTSCSHPIQTHQSPKTKPSFR